MKCIVRAAFTLMVVVGLILVTVIPAAAETEVALLAGQYINIGTVSISDDGSNLTITYQTNEDWAIGETHLAVAADPSDIPQTRSSNPKVGQFDPGVVPSSVDAHTITYIVPVPDGIETLYIAAHAVVTNTNGQDETAWGEGNSFEGSNWAMYIEYPVGGSASR